MKVFKGYVKGKGLMFLIESNDKIRKEEEDGWLKKQCLVIFEVVGGQEGSWDCNFRVFFEFK